MFQWIREKKPANKNGETQHKQVNKLCTMRVQVEIDQPNDLHIPLMVQLESNFQDTQPKDKDAKDSTNTLKQDSMPIMCLFNKALCDKKD